MREKPRRRLSDKDLSGASYVDVRTSITGTLCCSNDVVVAGAIKGEVRAGGCFTLYSVGRWEGNIEAAEAIIAGQVQGTVNVKGKLEVRRSARVRGSLTAGTIAVAEGAVIDGEMSCTGDPGVVKFEEKRRQDRSDEKQKPS